MSSKRVRTLLSICLAIAGIAQTAGAPKHGKNNTIANLPVKEIRDLSYAIKAADSYREDKRREIKLVADSLATAATDLERCELTLHLFVIYRPINTDSALYYANRARIMSQTLDLSMQQRGRIAIVSALATSGLFTEACRLFDQMDENEMAPEIKIRYWLTGRRLYGYMKSYAEGNEIAYNKYERLNMHYDSLLVKHLPEGHLLKRFIECEQLVENQRYAAAKVKLEALLEDIPTCKNLYGMAAYQMAEVYRHLGDEYNYTVMLAASALCDVKTCVAEGLALPTLAEVLYEHGRFSEAFSFVNFALDEATAGGARMRAVTIARLVPLIDDAYQEKVNSSRDELMIYFLLVIVLLIITVVLIVILYRRNKQGRATAAKLAMTTKRQDSYIGNFMGLYSGYADRLNRLTKLVSNKIAAGQAAELKKLIDSGKYEDQDNDNIHKIFDSAFLDIYPNFVEQINSLLRPDERIVVKTPGTLTPELRIYAFVKLGVDESTRIAQTLQYSPNTVYTYRNKIRNKAIKRDTFDEDVAALR